VAYERWPVVANGGQLLLDDLPPGKYEVTRKKPKSYNGGFLCDRRTVTVESGKTTTSQIVRRRGAVVEGQIVGLKEGMFAQREMIGPQGEMSACGRAPSAIVSVHPAQATGDLHSDWAGNRITYDALVCGADGKFRTERLLPGQYAIIAEAYRPEKYSGTVSTDWPTPDFVGRAVVTVPDGGPPPPVKIELRPRTQDREGIGGHAASGGRRGGH
jgi:hypothetical protein